MYTKESAQLDVGPSILAFLTVLKENGKWCPRANFEFAAPSTDFNRFPLCDLGMNAVSATITVCNTCAGHMDKVTIPPRAIANDLWIGECSETMKALNIPTKLLCSPVRQKAYICKFKSHGSRKSAQRSVTVKGSMIAYPQENALLQLGDSLPHPISELARFLSVVFVNSSPSSEEQLKKFFQVESTVVKECLHEWKNNSHPEFQHTSFDLDELNRWEASGKSMTTFLNTEFRT